LKEKSKQTSNPEWKVGRSFILFSRVYEKESMRINDFQKPEKTMKDF